jgi:hypothetical protein
MKVREPQDGGKTARRIILSAAWFGIGIVVAEAVNVAAVFDFRLRAMFVGAVFSMLYLALQLLLDFLRKQSERSAYRRLKFFYLLFVWIVGVLFLVSIPLLWWGVILKLATVANEGGRHF